MAPLEGKGRGGEAGRGVARFGCHHSGVTPFYDENSSKLPLKTFLNVVATVSVNFMRPKAQNNSFRSQKRLFLLCNHAPHLIAIIDCIVCEKLAKK